MEQYEEIIQRAWSDEGFKTQLMSNPKTALAEMGQKFNDGITLEAHENTTDTLHFVLLDKSQLGAYNLDDDPIIGKITKRAHEDEDYKTRLLNDSKAAIQEVLGIEPQGHVHIHANTESHVHIVLPTNPNTTGDLSDADLAMVAGGKNINEMFCSMSEKLFEAGKNYFTGSSGGYLGALGALANPLMTGGIIFAREASAT